MCGYFLVLAPDAIHADTLEPCNQASYANRGWCRLEQWAHATGGFSDMFVFGSSRRLELSTQADSLKDAIFVFEGDFSVRGRSLERATARGTMPPDARC